jgi:hypothetical protein
MSNDGRVWEVIENRLIVFELKFAEGQIEMSSPLRVFVKIINAS